MTSGNKKEINIYKIAKSLASHGFFIEKKCKAPLYERLFYVNLK